MPEQPTNDDPKPAHIEVSHTGEVRVTVDGVVVDADEFMKTIKAAGGGDPAPETP